MKEITLTALPWDKEEVGICSDDLEQIKADQANWVDVKFDGNKISAKVREVHRGSNWPKDLHPIYIQETRWKEKLKFPSIYGHNATNPSAVELTVKKRTLPPMGVIWPALAIFAVFAIAATFTALSTIEITELADFKLGFGIVAFAFTLIGIAIQVYGIYKQMQ